jgi:hypothetical protein
LCPPPFLADGDILQHIWARHPAFDILVPSRSGDRHASQGSSDTTTSHETDGDILQHIQAHIPPFNAVHGEWRGMAAAVETPPGI